MITAGFKQKALSGTLITLIAQLLKFVIQFAWSITLARLLGANSFGVYAMATPILALAMLVQDLGLVQSIITRREISNAALSSMFYISVIVSGLFATVLASSSSAISAFYKSNSLKNVILMMATTLLLSGAVSVQRALLMRNYRFRQLAFVEILSLMLGAAASICWAVVWPSPLALVASNLCAGLVLLIGATIAAQWLPGRPASFHSIVDMLRFGGGLTGFNLANYISRNADNILIGRFLGPVPLGYYDRAYKLMLTPLQQVNAPMTSVMLPILAKLRDDPERYRRAYLRALSLLLGITIPAIVFFLVAADPLIPFALGDQWRPAIGIFAWLALAGLHQPLTHTMGWLLVSQQRSADYAAQGIFGAVVSVAAFLIGINYGAVGVAAAYAVSNVMIVAPVMVWWACRRGPVSISAMITMAWPQALSAGIAIGLLAAIKALLTTSPIITLITLFASSYLFYWMSLTITSQGRDVLTEGLDLVRPNLYPIVEQSEDGRPGQFALMMATLKSVT